MEYLRKCAKQFNIEIDDKQLGKFEIFYKYLIEKNKVMNLTAITEKNEVIIKHFLDSIALVNYIQIEKKNIIDIGTGAGFPGIPLKILKPDIHLTLLDSLKKRINFLDEVIEKCELLDVKTIHGRAEDFAHNKDYREKYDYALSRAVSNLSTLSEYCIPFVNINGCFISYKSGNMEEELNKSKNSIFLCGGKYEKTEKFYLPDTDIERSFIFIKKVKNTARQYPRKSGIPSKNPL